MEVLLGIVQVVGREALGGDVAEDNARVGGQRGYGLAVGVVEAEVALPVLGRQGAVHAQQAGQLVGRQGGHAGDQLFGLAEKARGGRAGRRKGTLGGHRLGAGEEYLHGVSSFAGCQATEQAMPSASTRAAMARSSSRGTFSSVGQGVSRSSE